MNLQKVIATSAPPQLSHGLDKRGTFNVTNCASKLNYADVRLFICVINGHLGHFLDPILNSICEVGNDLYCFAQIVAFPFTVNDMLINLAGCDVAISGQGDVQIALVVAQIEVYFTSIVQHEAFAMPVSGQLPRLEDDNGMTHSVGAMVPASMLRYGSILMEDTC